MPYQDRLDAEEERATFSPPSGVCSSCGDECFASLIDFGHGYTECGSHGETDVDLQWCSGCCEAEVLTEEEAVKRQCCECKAWLPENEHEPRDGVTHTYCDPCAAAAMQEANEHALRIAGVGVPVTEGAELLRIQGEVR